MLNERTRSELRDFLTKGNVFNNKWFYLGGLDIYLRRSWHALPELGVRFMLDIPNVTALNPGTGRFTETLEFLEATLVNDCPTIFGVYVEGVMNERFVKYLDRHGYVVIKNQWEPTAIPCMFNILNPDTSLPMQKATNYVRQD